MGSPASAVVAHNIYVEFFEELSLESTPTKHVLWKSYSDDTFCTIKRGIEELPI